MKVKFIVNPVAGGGKGESKAIPTIHRVFSRTSVQYDVQTTRGRGHGTRLAREALTEGYGVVVAVGGDGTVNEVATGLVNTDSTLGIVPLGSGNGLARGLGIPLDVEKACQALLEGGGRRIDVGRTEGRYFFATAGVGFDALLSRQYHRRSGRRRGVLPYFYLAAREAFAFEPEETVLKFNGREIVVTPFILTVANTGQYGGGAIIAPDARPDDGLFDVCIVHNLNALEALYHSPKLFTGEITKIRQMEVHRTCALEIIRADPSPFHIDGDPFDGNPRLNISLLPKALKVSVPYRIA